MILLPPSPSPSLVWHSYLPLLELSALSTKQVKVHTGKSGIFTTTGQPFDNWHVIFEPKVGQIGPKRDKSWTFSDHFQYIWITERQRDNSERRFREADRQIGRKVREMDKTWDHGLHSSIRLLVVINQTCSTF